ncbi:MAG: ferritin-like domain-containing protein [Myxococcota bacterium]
MQSFHPDHDAIQQHAKKNLADGAVTGAGAEKVAAVIEALNASLATEIVCELRYRAHFHAAEDLGEVNVAAEFLEHAEQEREHGKQLAARIAQLGGEPDFDPTTLLERSHAAYTAPGTVAQMLEDNLVAERVAVQVYTELARWLGDEDPTSRRLIEDILKQEEEHADDLAGLRNKLKGRE